MSSSHPPRHTQEPTPAEGHPSADHPAASMPRRWWLGAAAVGLTAGAAGYWWHGRSSGPAAGSQAVGAQGAGPAAPAGGSGLASSTSHEQLGADFWALKLPQATGTELLLESLRGRPLLINFWATWCPPCVREMPLLNSFYRQHQGKGLQMIGIAVDGAKPVAAFLERSPVDFPIALAGADGSGLARTLGNTGGGLPYTVLAGSTGAVIRRQMGELQAQTLAEWAQAFN